MIVSFISRGKRKGAYFTIREDDLRYLLIEADGEVLYRVSTRIARRVLTRG
jgi:hypothetical protein